MGRISITEPSLQRPDILVYSHQYQYQQRQKQSSLSSSHPSRTIGFVLVASTQSNHLLLYSLPVQTSPLPPPLPPPQQDNQKQLTENMTRTKLGSVKLGTHIDPPVTPVTPVRSSGVLRGKISLPTGHLVKGVCFGSSTTMTSSSSSSSEGGVNRDGDGDGDMDEVWVLSLIKAKRGTTSLASIGDRQIDIPPPPLTYVTHIFSCKVLFSIYCFLY